MQSGRGDRVKPLVSVVTTLAFPRRRPVDCLRSWTSGQRFDGEVELVVVSDARRPRLERRVQAALRPGDRLVRLPGADEIAQYELGARVARGDWLLFTEPHVEALPDCLAELFDHVRREDLAGACVRTLPQHDASRVARMESRMYHQDPAGWTRDGDWRTFTKRGVLVAREAYLDAGGVDPARQRFAETALAQRLRELGHRVGYAPRAGIRHQNSTHLAELLAYVWEYRRQGQAEAHVPALVDACADGEWARVGPAVIGTRCGSRSRVGATPGGVRSLPHYSVFGWPSFSVPQRGAAGPRRGHQRCDASRRGCDSTAHFRKTTAPTPPTPTSGGRSETSRSPPDLGPRTPGGSTSQSRFAGRRSGGPGRSQPSGSTDRVQSSSTCWTSARSDRTTSSSTTAMRA
jgi:hypothetical protein